MATGIPHFFEPNRFISNVGLLVEATINFYYEGTTNPAPIYADSAMTVPLTNPVTLAVGAIVPTIYLDPAIAYRRKIVYGDGSVQDSPKLFALGYALSSDLIASTGASTLGYVGRLSGMIARTVADKLNDNVSVFDFMTTAQKNDVINRTNLVDVTAAIQTAVSAVGAAGGGDLHFPAGLYRISGEITVTNEAVRLVGASRYNTLIYQTSLGSKIFNVTGAFCSISKLSFIYSGTPLVNSAAVFVQAGYFTMTDFVIRSAYIGVYFESDLCVAGKLEDFEILDYEASAVVCDNAGDIFLSKFIMNAGNTTRGSLGGIRLSNQNEAIVVQQGDILLGQYSLTTEATTYSAGLRPAYCKFTDVYFDSSAYGTLLNNTVETEFTSCWFSAGRSGAGFAGLTLLTTDSVTFSHCNFINCGSHGANVTSNAKRTVFSHCKFESNSVTTGPGISHGCAFASNTTDFMVVNCIAHNGLLSGQQGYGVFVNTGSSDRYIIADNLVTGNLTGGYADGGTGTNKRIENNY